MFNRDVELERELAALSQDLHPGRWRTFRIESCRMEGSMGDRRERVARYLTSVGLFADHVGELHSMSRDDAAAVCRLSAQFTLAHDARQMSADLAAKLTDAWMARWPDDATWLTNADLGARLPKHPSAWCSGRVSVFHTDFEVGVIAVDDARVGMFFSHEDS